MAAPTSNFHNKANLGIGLCTETVANLKVMKLMGPLTKRKSVSAESSLNQRGDETDVAWTARVQDILIARIEKIRSEGTSVNRILLLMPPKFLEKIYSVTFACTREEAKKVIFEELKKNGYLSLFGACVISNESILYPEVQALGDLRQAQKNAKLQALKFFGGRNPKKS